MAENNKDNTQTHIVLTKGIMVSHYRVIERIGAGGMGEVYLAEDTKPDLRVALKFLSYQHSQNEEALQEIDKGRRLILANDPENPFPLTGEQTVNSSYLGRFTQAEKILNDAIPRILKKSDRFSEALYYYAIGRMEIIRGNYPKAIGYFQHGIPLSKGLVRPRMEYYLFIAYIIDERPAEAIPLLERYTSCLESLYF